MSVPIRRTERGELLQRMFCAVTEVHEVDDMSDALVTEEAFLERSEGSTKRFLIVHVVGESVPSRWVLST